MDLGLNGKKALVTGSTAGIGLAVAQGLAREGASVVVNGRTQERVDQAIAQVKEVAPNADVTGIAADLSTAAGVVALIEKLPSVDVLVNNLGVFEPKPFEEITDDDWLDIFQANVMSGVRLTRHYLAGLRERNWGRVIFVSSESAVQIPVEMIHYGVTKTAQVALARGIAETLVGTNVTVNSVLVGPTKSEGVGIFVSQMAKKEGVDDVAMEKQFFETARPSSLIKRFETTEEVANMIVYLSSEQASATTGSAVRVDGGVTRAIL
ncbi:MAG: SDR family NAD(P)-dependent oxidoreductase [Capsulimonas sp.]|uniref:SDR family NAD(P)-dependent oxidoreductase n=1 Tax=Capsulimonas sp. TaxID=2494211 RepID=UPI0032646591